MFIEPNVIFMTTIILALGCALGWGILLGEHQQRIRQQCANVVTGRWATIRFPKVHVDAMGQFIQKWEQRGFEFESETRANGDRYGTIYMKRWVDA